MPLLNYTSKVDIYTTIGAIQGCLVKHGARKIMQDYDNEGKPSGSVQELPINSMKQAKNTWFFRDPLSAIVSVTEDGIIQIEGAKTSWVYDIEPDWTESGMIPQISDYKVCLNIPSTDSN